MEKLGLIDSLFFLQISATLIYIFFLSICTIGLRRIKSNPVNNDRPFISVVIAARNEEENIGACLRHLAQQKYPRTRYEVIVIDDHSEDNTHSIVESFGKDNVMLLSLHDTDGVSPKKAALHQGIKASRGEIILTTDADCCASPLWIETMVSYFGAKTGVVASWLTVEENKSLLSKLERLDSLSLSLVGAAGFGLKRPFMANGANFAYRRKVYDELNGFAGVDAYASGDDDLLLQKVHASQNWECAFAPDARCAVVTKANRDLRGFFAQRFRWASKGRIYPKILFLLESFIYFYYLSLPVAMILFILNGFVNLYILLPLALKFMADFIFMRLAARKLQEKINPFILFITEWLQIAYVLLSGVWGLWGTYSWKGRRYTKGKVRMNRSSSRTR
ncbi:glycosyltransferase [candidate division KSB1 bacterium]|nr:glycosyltransferase [candidate division KSB1 bacterium]RQW08784.1 MAG: glycosyltransferase [candidate division KSB1 bacterium]